MEDCPLPTDQLFSSRVSAASESGWCEIIPFLDGIPLSLVLVRGGFSLPASSTFGLVFISSHSTNQLHLGSQGAADGERLVTLLTMLSFQNAANTCRNYLQELFWL